MAQFFINRPIFAWVITILVCLCGILAIHALPVEQYPNLTPTTVRITAVYPGASAKTLEDTVTQIIEQNMTGLDDLLYMSSQSSNAGTATVTLTFQTGYDPDEAMVQVQNQLQSAMRMLPPEVQQQGLKVTKSGDDLLMMISFVSTDGKMSKADVADYAISNVQDPLSRVEGVGSIDVFSSPYAMRIWLNPAKLVSYKLTTQDVIQAIKAQNTQIAVGQIGGAPAVKGQAINATITAASLLKTPKQFRAITLRVNQDGSEVTLGDVAKVELGMDGYSFLTRYNGKPAAGMAINLSSGANELQTDILVKQKLAELSQFFPKGLQAKVAYETTPFVKESLKDVVKTIIEAIVLVFLVMYLFLQNIRATLIPSIAMPVVLLGTFAILYAFNFSINTLTMFAMVLAIGLLVDDAIVVVENVERIMAEEGLSPKEATKKSMKQIQGALVSIALVLSAVFVPMAFFGGTTGAIYRQFSVTIVSAMALSVLVAMILTPALCATLLKPIKPDHQHKTGFFGWFNRTFERNKQRYENSIDRTLHSSKRYILIYILIVIGLACLFMKLPTSFLPSEDRGVFMTMVQLPAGSTQEQTLQVVEKAEQYYLQHEKKNIVSVMATVGAGPGGNGQNVARLFVKLKDWDQRTTEQDSSFAIIKRAQKYFNTITNARIIVANPPAIPGLGTSSGFDLELMDNGNLGHSALMNARDQLLKMASHDPLLVRVRHNGLDDAPQLNIHIDQHKAQALGVSINDINDTLQTAWGSSYVNNFIDEGRVKKVYVQSEADYRMLPSDLNFWYVRNNKGLMVPFSAFTTTSWTKTSPRLERYNGNPAVEIVGEAADGVSTGTAMQEMEKLVTKLPKGIGSQWTGISYQEKIAGSTAPALYALSILVVFLCLAALYESWSIPFSVMLVVPLGVLGSVIATLLRGLDNDIYFQVGLLTIIGLSAKNAILIVEFANELHQKGTPLFEAAKKAAKLRLRPILMTSFAFIFGVLPMAISHGAGSASQHAVGTGVIGGMLSATLLAIFFIPLFFVLIRHYFPNKQPED